MISDEMKKECDFLISLKLNKDNTFDIVDKWINMDLSKGQLVELITQILKQTLLLSTMVVGITNKVEK
jgi:hypothetical protein